MPGGPRPKHPVTQMEGADAVGTELGGYRIESVLGSGGMGVVYRAVELESGAEIALKLLRSALMEEEDRRRRFVREAKLAATLDHPGIVKTLRVGDDGGDAFIAMELVAGKSLKARIADEAAATDHPDVAKAVALAQGMALAVRYAHEKGIVHRDLKPDNVMVTPDGSVRVLDFGLAKLRETEGGALYQAETETSLTHDGHVLGTPGYMAPEQASGKEVSFPADVFAMGAILYELLTGQRAFGGNSAIDVIVAVTRDQPPLPSTKNPAVGSALDALVMRCLEKDPAARPTMTSLAAALARPALLARDPTTSSGERLSPIRSRTLLFAFFVVVLAGGVLLFVSPRSGARAPADAGAALDAAPIPTAITALPLPASNVPAALDAYKTAIGDEHAGNMDAAGVDFEEATKLDPTLAAAHLRLALLRATTEADPARTHFAIAVKHRDRLSVRDRALLEAAQRLFQSEPPDPKGFVARLELLVQQYPGDAELLYELSNYHDVVGEFAVAEQLSQRAVALDPTFGLAWSNIAEIQAYRGKFEESLATVKKCLEVTPEASWCIWVAEFINGAEGHCELNEAYARRRIAIDPNIHDGYKALLYTSMCLRKPEPLLLEALDQTVQRIPDELGKKRFRLYMLIRIAAIKGDFVSAAKLTEDLRALVATRTDTSDHAAATLISAEIELEAGRPDRAAAIAKAFVERHEVWQGEPTVHDYSMAGDLTPLILTFVHDPKYMPGADYRAALEGWRTRNDAGAFGDYRPYVWVYGYAAPVVNADDAKIALEALPRYSPIPPFLPNGALPALSVGRTLWLGGNEEQGLAYLERASKQCWLGTRPMQSITSHAWFAEALEKKGDQAGACRELGTLLSFWGNAKPRSVTADWARVRSRALGCADAPR